MPEYVTIPDVELFGVGMNWPAAHGSITFRFDHLADAVAAQEDPHIIRPRLTIGHSDETFNPDGEHHDPFTELGDGYPALGSIENMRLVNDGAMVIGDFVEVPDWFAEVMPSAYPNRSVEGAYLDGRWDVLTPGGKTYGFVLTKLALLGIHRPAVEDLEDLRRFLVEGDGVVVAGTQPEGGEPVTAGIGAVPGATLKASIDKVRETFWADFAQDERYWWWPRDIWTQPNEVIADDDEGNLYRIPFSSNDDQEVTFGDPVRVLQEFIDAPASAVTAAARSICGRRGEPAASFDSRADAGRKAKREGGANPSATTQGMDPAAELRKVLDLPEDATDEQVQAALAERNGGGETPETPAETPETPEPETPEATPETPETPETPAEPSAGALPDGMVAVPAETWRQVQENASAGASLASETETRRRDDTITAATEAGKIRPTDRESMVTLHGSNRDAFYKLLTASVEDGGLREGLVPTDERGTSREADPAAAGAGSAEDMSRLGFAVPQPEKAAA